MRTSFDAGRGCPFLCSFCTIINVQGRKSRSRNADDIENIVRANLAQGVRNFFITDDNLARNQNWEAIFDRLIKMREVEGQRFYIVAQVDTMAHKVRGFIEKAGRAGVNRVFIGLENINPDSLKGARKGQNQITEYRTMLQAWHRVGALTYAGYILGFPGDTPESIERDIGIIQRELPIDLLEFFILTPLPGSADHKKLYLADVEMERDMNKYDVVHVTTAHATMSNAELLAIYHKAWDLYYSVEHVETVLRRAQEWGYDPRNMMMKLLMFHAVPRLERVHPLEGGLFRRKVRRDRRPGMKLENHFSFYAGCRHVPAVSWRTEARYAQQRRCSRHGDDAGGASGILDVGDVQRDARSKVAGRETDAASGTARRAGSRRAALRRGARSKQNKKARQTGPQQPLPRLRRADLRGLRAFRAIGHFKCDALIFFQRLEASVLNFRKVGEQILTAAIGCNEAEAFSVVEPLDRTLSHACLSWKFVRA
jgi:hypothetical protein